jgi:hypothetical protein
MDELFSALLGWAVVLSGYPAPVEVPRVERVPHAFFVENACGGRECKVWGWYAGGNVLYIDSRLNPADDLLASSVIVHEMTHYLQAQAGKLEHRATAALGGSATATSVNCELTIELEREAYAVQQAYLVRYGVYRPIGVSMHAVGCGEDAARAQLKRYSDPETGQHDATHALEQGSKP